MSVHWKDEPNPLKQIRLVDVETASDLCWTTIICGNQTEKSSLAYHLKECELDNKLDMPIYYILKYYKSVLKETNAIMAEQMCKVAEYFIINTISCQRLMVKRNAINKYREVASVAFISLYDSHYFAIGIKVHNLLSAIKGLKNKYPVTGLDFTLLYLNLIMTYNLSPDKIILSRKHANSLRKVDKREELEKEISLAEARGEVITNALKSEYSSVSFNVACLDAQQLT
ncbi:14660_t:CDS:2 [Funneliformis geosporum]|uniref:14660_t:CDS:1 n=1 Tax=Funneliformis geosporum TaxID=1117311 RepID=A0A9W4WNU4_9GLOM|nr:14660_t:CDS:2 [Funneliformis geosporum]